MSWGKAGAVQGQRLGSLLSRQALLPCPLSPTKVVNKSEQIRGSRLPGETKQLWLGLECTCLLVQIAPLESGLTEAQVPCSQKEFSERQSDREEVDLLKEIYSPQTQRAPSRGPRVWDHLGKWERPWEKQTAKTEPRPSQKVRASLEASFCGLCHFIC